MLLVKTAVRPSGIAGSGLFADEDIKKGQMVWKYTPDSCVILSQTQLEVLMHSSHNSEVPNISYYLTYGYYVTKFDGILVCLDNGRFVNHSEQPCIGPSPHLSDDMAWQYSVALRDIEKGEEIIENYETYDSCEWYDDFCRKFNIFNPSGRRRQFQAMAEAAMAV